MKPQFLFWSVIPSDAERLDLMVENLLVEEMFTSSNFKFARTKLNAVSKMPLRSVEMFSRFSVALLIMRQACMISRPDI